jgi:hypothetical protein
LEYAEEIIATAVKMHADRQSKTRELFIELIWHMTLKSMVMPVANIILTTAGRIPFSVAFTPPYFKSLLRSAAIQRMMIKDGRTTPSVADNAPQKPPCDEPTKVAILTAIGPGVDSATAIKFNSSFSVSQPLARQSSLIREIIP